MREVLNDDAAPGQRVTASLAWSDDDPIRPGATVEATDGPMGVVRDRRYGEGPEHAYIGVDTGSGGELLYVPDRLIRETLGTRVMLSLPAADVRAHASAGALPVRERPDELPHERHAGGV